MAKKGKLNLPNTLSLIRVIMVPFFMATILLMDYADCGIWAHIVPALLFGLTGLTDMLDGKIARKYNLVTDFGKFIDPLADKFMVFGALISILVAYRHIADVFVWVSAIVMLRELAITSLRLVVVGKSGRVIAASWWGKVKTASQIVCIILILLERVIVVDLWRVLFDKPLYNLFDTPYISWASMLVILVTTVGSGIDYIRAYWPDLDTNK